MFDDEGLQTWADIPSLPLSFTNDVMSDEVMIQHKKEVIVDSKKVVNITSYEVDEFATANDPSPSVQWLPLNIETAPMNSKDREFSKTRTWT